MYRNNQILKSGCGQGIIPRINVYNYIFEYKQAPVERVLDSRSRIGPSISPSLARSIIEEVYYPGSLETIFERAVAKMAVAERVGLREASLSKSNLLASSLYGAINSRDRGFKSKAHG